MDSNFIRHEACPSPKCNSSDGFALYDDGHGWCFSCGWYQPASESLSVEKAKARVEEPVKTPFKALSLPFEATDQLPPKVEKWLRSYGITGNEIVRNSFLWNPRKETLIYPIYNDNYSLVMYQERNFGVGGKWFKTYGSREDVFKFYGKVGEKIVIVEDILSAIKVGRHCCALPLFGSNLSKSRIIRLSVDFARLSIWLDFDKLSEAIKARQEALPYFDKGVNVISSQKDPKAYSDKAISEWLLG